MIQFAKLRNKFAGIHIYNRNNYFLLNIYIEYMYESALHRYIRYKLFIEILS